MARPFDKTLSLTGPKPTGAARSRRATFPSITAKRESCTISPLTAVAQDSSQGGEQVVKKDKNQTTSEPKHKMLSRRATYPSVARSELPISTPLTAPVANTSQHSDQTDKKNEPQFKGEPMHEILPQLYLGDLRAAENTEKLSSKNIYFVLTIKEGRLTPAVRDAYRIAQISHVHISKSDVETEDLLSVFEPVCDMIEGRMAKGKGVLVHCVLGKSRSVTVVIAFIMRQMNVSYQEAKVLVQSKRAIASPNNAFRGQLLTWEKCKFDLRNVRMVGQGTPSDPWAQGFQHKRKGRKVADKGKAEKKGQGGEKEIKKETDAKEVKANGVSEKTDGKSNEKKNGKKDDIPKGGHGDEDGKATKTQASNNDQQTQQTPHLPATEVVLTAKGAAVFEDDEGSSNPGKAKENAKDETFAEDNAKKDEKIGELQASENHPDAEQPAPPTASAVIPAEQGTPSDATKGEGGDIGRHGAEGKDPNKDESPNEDSENKDGKIEKSNESAHRQPGHPCEVLRSEQETPSDNTKREGRDIGIQAAEVKDHKDDSSEEDSRDKDVNIEISNESAHQHPPHPATICATQAIRAQNETQLVTDAENNLPKPLETSHNTIEDEKPQQTDPIQIEPTPSPEIIRAALKPLYLQYPVMGKKKLLRMLNESQGWNMGCKEFRGHCEAVGGA